MFPLFLCLFSTSTDNLAGRISRETQTQPSIWWNPNESATESIGLEIHEGDILMSSIGRNNIKNAIKSGKYLWENGIIPFGFGDDFSCSEKNQILDAMKVLENNTCIRFVEKENQKTYIKFQKEKNGCYAPVGLLAGNEGPLPVNLQSPECINEQGIIEHELLHVIGLFHEQSRPDRDEFVTIHWCNIQPQSEKDFRKGNNLQVTTFDVPYDYKSIMHYPKFAFSRNGKPTITAKGDPDMDLGQRERPSKSDFEKVNKMYKCNVGGEHVFRPEAEGVRSSLLYRKRDTAKQ